MPNKTPLDYIAPLDRETLEESIETGKMNAQTDALMAQERVYIQAWRRQRGDEACTLNESSPLIGLALSGGGIRSATFSLGVMQALASQHLLSKMDYLSTVSGGGYMGAAVTWLSSHMAQTPETENFGTDRHNFPFGSDNPRDSSDAKDSPQQKKMLHYLQEHGYFLTPGAGINAFTLLGAVLRGTVLNLMVWLPMFVCLYWSVMQLSRALINQSFASHFYLLPFLLDRLKPNDKMDNTFQLTQERLPELLMFEMSLISSAIILVLFFITPIMYSFSTWYCHDKTAARRTSAYNQRHQLEVIISGAIPLVIFLLIFGSLPLVAAYLGEWVKMTGPAAMVTGIILALRDFVKSAEKKKPSNVTLVIAAIMLLYGISLISFQAAFFLSKDMLGYDTQHTLVLSGLLVFPLLMGFFVNINYISIHRFYRDRLMETFMPDIDQAQCNVTGQAQGANTTLLHDFNESAPRSPYHIVNTNFITVDSKDPHLRHRGGDNFILSPYYCGSNSTGWRHTGHFMDGKMTLSTAVAISGAAANPNTGVGGMGVTRNPFVSLVMSLLNFRLGYWVHHPKILQGNRVSWWKRKFTQTPNYLRPGAYAYFSTLGADVLGYNENRAYLQLSDGGHFENMGLYELIRRRVKVAIVCDGAADPEFSFSDMQTSLQRIEYDFGVRVELLDHASPDQVIPVVNKAIQYPPNTSFAKQGHMVGKIFYADGTTGWLIVLKTTLIDDVSFQVKGYKAKNPRFPDQTTADQFFDETQFEAYRELGFCITEKMLGERLEDIDQGETLGQLIQRCAESVD